MRQRVAGLRADLPGKLLGDGGVHVVDGGDGVAFVIQMAGNVRAHAADPHHSDRSIVVSHGSLPFVLIQLALIPLAIIKSRSA